MAGLLSARRPVPANIERPPYAFTGDPGPSRAPVTRSRKEALAMHKAGTDAAEVLILAGQLAKPGISTDEIDALVHEEAMKRNAYPSPLNYRGFPKSVCTSVNEVICHGIPDSRKLRDGDIINIDVTLFKHGVHADTSCTFLVGEVDDVSKMLVRETRLATYAAIDVVKPGVALNEIGRVIEDHAKPLNLGVVRDFIGHGVGPEFHTNLQILHYYHPRLTTKIEEMMSFTIEPMLTLGTIDFHIWEDDWTAVTADGRRTAQFEHTMIVSEQGAELTTLTDSGECAADMVAAQLGA